VACLKRVFAKDYQPAEYRSLLAGFHGFHAAVEPLLDRALADAEGAAFRRPPRLPLLAADLVALGLAEADLGRVPVCPDPPVIAGLADAIGVAYVLEGSTQGGLLISKHLAGRLGEGVALRYYASHGEDALALWEAFKAALDAYGARRPECSAVVGAAANRTFERLAAWLDVAVL
jgi:heme oxygenase